MNRADLLTFNEGTVRSLIQTFEEAKSALIKAKGEYDEFVATQLEPNWNTPGGKATALNLKQYSNEHIQSYIDYCQQNINNLTEVIPYLVKIDNAGQ